MDLSLYLRVLWRFKLLVVAGLLLAMLLTLLSVARISFDGRSPELTYRVQEEWSSTATVFVTQEGFPLGRTIYDEFVPLRKGDQDAVAPRWSDPNRFSGHSALFARLAMSDEVRQVVLRDGPIDGRFSAQAAVPAEVRTVVLPMVDITAVSSSSDKAIGLARRASTAFLEFVRDQQESSGIPADRRVVLKLVNDPREATLVTERKMNRPLFIFIAVMSVVVALALVLENLRPRVRLAAGQESDVVSPMDASRKTA